MPSLTVQTPYDTETDLVAVFARHHHGRHGAADALFWLFWPHLSGPSGSEPSQVAILAAEERIRRAGAPLVADALLDALAALIESDRRMANRALQRACAALEDKR